MKGVSLRPGSRRMGRARRINLVCRLCGTPRPSRQQTRHRGRCRACASFGD